jgi:hypothetical protein
MEITNLKTKGFRFESTHLVHLDRIEKMMTLLTVGFCWAHKIGEWRAERKPIRWCQHRDSMRPQSSFFRYGFDFIRVLLSSFKKVSAFKFCIAVLLNNYKLSEAFL